MKQNKQAVARATDTAPAQFPVRHIEWPKVGKEGNPLTTAPMNALALLREANRPVRFNSFAGKVEIQLKGTWGPLEDSHVQDLYALAHHNDFKIKLPDLKVFINVLARHAAYHPVQEHLRSLRWDNTQRLDTWLSRYLGAEDTPLNRATGRSMLLALCKRVLEPGAEYHVMPVLEGPQGGGKSSALKIIAGPWHGDALKLGMDGKRTIELTRNVWLEEIAELAGQHKSETEQVKHHISRSSDADRLVWDSYTTNVPRQFIMVGTTNDAQYLRDMTGARRFYPVRVGKIDLAALAKDRDQLLVEAYAEVTLYGAPIGIPADLWPAAAEAQEARRERSPIEEAIREVLPVDAAGFIAKSEIRRALGRPNAAEWKPPEFTALATAMHKLGWESSGDKRKRAPDSGDLVPFFQKTVQGQEPSWWVFNSRKFVPHAEPPADAGF